MDAHSVNLSRLRNGIGMCWLYAISGEFGMEGTQHPDDLTPRGGNRDRDSYGGEM